MNNNLEMKIFLPVLSLMTVGSVVAEKTKQEKKPNVIIIFSDQHNAGVFGYQGHPDVKTPNFDAMAKGGVVFNRAYSQNAISAPSRNSFFTGLYPRTIGYMDNALAMTKAMSEAVSMQASFHKSGYDTYAFGKRHLDDKADEGWDLTKSHLASESPNSNYVSWIEQEGEMDEFGEDWSAEFGKYPNGNSKAKTPFPTSKMGTRTSKLMEDKTMEAFTASNTLEVIRKHQKSSSRPFFCFTSFYHPHQPYTPLPKYLAMYDITKWGEGTKLNDGLKMPESLRQPSDELPPLLSALRKSKNGIWCLGLAAEDEQLYRNYIGSYYALVSEVDAWVGEIFKELEKTGQAENTIVIYTSDHGDFVGGHGMIEKAAMGHNVYEETLRIPLMFFWKGKIAPSFDNDNLTGLIDVYPTLMELTGVKKLDSPYALQGLSLAKTLMEKKPLDREYMVSENWSQASVVTKDYKLGIWLDPTVAAANRDFRAFGDMFFERTSDKTEVQNRFNDPILAGEKAKLQGYYQEFTNKISDEGKLQMVDNFIKGVKRPDRK